MKLRCVTLNLKGTGCDWFDKRVGVVVNGLESLNPDVVCFQESTIKQEGTEIYNQARVIGKRIGLANTAFTPYGNPVEIMSREQGGIAIISRWPFSNIRTRRLCPGHGHTADVRVATFATLLNSDGELDVATSHFSWRPEESEVRLIQMGMVLHEFAASYKTSKGRCVLAGDFNATEGEPAIKLATEQLRDAYRTTHPNEPGFTWSDVNPFTHKDVLQNRRIDYVFVPSEAHVRTCDVVLNQPSPVYPSDHFGVMADLEW